MQRGDYMNFIIDNWFIIVAIVCCMAFVVIACVKFTGLPTTEQVENIKEWLKWAVTMAEKELSSGTGQLKLRMVYNMFIEKFPNASKMVAFEVFSGWVDDALVWMKDQLTTNKNVKNIVEGSSGTGEQ